MEDFANSMVNIYFSDFETKVKLAFNLIDFNLDGKLTKNEVKLFLVYAEIWPQEKLKRAASTKSVTSVNHKERHKYRHRVQQISEIEEYLHDAFGLQKSIKYFDFVEMTKNKSSELFSAALIMMHQKLPCTEKVRRLYEEFKKSPKDKHSEKKLVKENMKELGAILRP